MAVSFSPAPTVWRRLAPEPLRLESDEVHVWRARLGVNAAQRQALFQTLSADERARSARFHFPQDRERFVAARGILRALLARYLNADPSQLSFRYNPHGKPALAAFWDHAGIRFNLSHSEGLALYAVSRHREVGIDLEFIRPHLAQEPMAEGFFSPREVAMLRSLPAPIQPEAFFHCWTRKEAFLKALGQGLSISLDQFDVSLLPGEPAALLRTSWDPLAASRWSLQSLTPSPDYAAVLAVEGLEWQLHCWHWPEQSVEAPSPSSV